MKMKLALVALCLSLVACGGYGDKPSATVESAPSETASETTTAAQPATQPAAAAAAGSQLAVDAAKSSIGFVGAKVTGTHEGGFKAFTGHAMVDDSGPVGVEFVIDMGSTWSDSERLTGHLKSGDFFDVENHSEATFKSTAIVAGGEGEGVTHTVTGDLTLRGTTKSISFPAMIQVGPGGARGSAEFTIDRQQFGVSYPGRPDDLIKDDVLIKLDLYFS